MSRFPILTAAAAALIALAAPAAARSDSAKDYNLFVFGDYVASNASLGGRAAIGGSAKISNYALGQQLDDGFKDKDTLIVGKTLSFSSGSIKGNAVAGEGLALSSHGISGTASVGVVPVDFAGEALRLKTLSTTLAKLAANGTTTAKWGGLFLVGSSPSLNIFDLSGADLASAWGLNIAIPTGALALFNINGASGRMQNMGFGTQTLAKPGFAHANSLDASRLLFNFHEASALTLSGVGVPGTILAPFAALTLQNGAINGTVIAASANGSAQINHTPYAGSLLDPPAPLSNIGVGAPLAEVNAVPEPATWLSMLLGFGLGGAALRRKRAMAHHC